MNSMRLAVLVVGFVLAACATHKNGGEEQPIAVRPSPVVVDGKARAPVTLAWEELKLGETSATLVAHVVKKAPLALPLVVRLEVPAWVTVEKGRSEFALEAGSAGEVTETYELTFTQKPDADLVLHVDGESAGMGLHLHAEYAFGRAPAPVVGPKATGESFNAKGRDTGPSISLDGK